MLWNMRLVDVAALNTRADAREQSICETQVYESPPSGAHNEIVTVPTLAVTSSCDVRNSASREIVNKRRVYKECFGTACARSRRR